MEPVSFSSALILANPLLAFIFFFCLSAALYIAIFFSSFSCAIFPPSVLMREVASCWKIYRHTALLILMCSIFYASAPLSQCRAALHNDERFLFALSCTKVNTHILYTTHTHFISSAYQQLSPFLCSRTHFSSEFIDVYINYLVIRPLFLRRHAKS